MNCYNHPEKASVATCIDCGKGLCKECASLYALPICNQCNTARVKNDKNVIMQKYIPSIIGAVVGLVFTYFITKDITQSVFSTIGEAIIMAYLFAGIPWGWYVISFITPKMFLFMSWFGWGMYFIIKFSLSSFVGIVAMPIGLINLFMKQNDANKKEQNILNNQ